MGKSLPLAEDEHSPLQSPALKAQADPNTLSKSGDVNTAGENPPRLGLLETLPIIPEENKVGSPLVAEIVEERQEELTTLNEVPFEASKMEKRKQLMKNDPFGEFYKDQCERVRKNSPYGSLKTWRLVKLIVKKGCDLRQEQFAMQVMSQFDQIFKAAKVDIWLKPYEIMCTGHHCGLVECVSDSVSLDVLNRKLVRLGIVGLPEFFTLYYENKRDLKRARLNFTKSLAGYSLLCYVLQIKDRHNANILFDREGHLIHIDFDFLISNSPGGNLLFEKAPFKFTQEYMEVMNGEKEENFSLFRNLMVKGFMALQKEYRKIMVLIEMMLSVNKNLPCFVGGPRIIPELKERLFPRIQGKDEEYPMLNSGEAVKFIDQ